MEEEKGKRNLQDFYEGRKKLTNAIKEHITEVFTESLNIIENVIITSSIPDEQAKELYKKVRSKILRVGNDAIRKSSEEIESYKILPLFTISDKIDFGNSKK